MECGAGKREPKHREESAYIFSYGVEIYFEEFSL